MYAITIIDYKNNSDLNFANIFFKFDFRQWPHRVCISIENIIRESKSLFVQITAMEVGTRFKGHDLAQYSSSYYYYPDHVRYLKEYII